MFFQLLQLCPLMPMVRAAAPGPPSWASSRRSRFRSFMAATYTNLKKDCKTPLTTISPSCIYQPSDGHRPDQHRQRRAPAMTTSWEMQLLEHPGEDVVHVRYDHANYGWQAVTYLCVLGGTALIEKACCPVRKRKHQAMADAKALGLPIRMN